MANSKELEQRIEQMRARLQELDAQAKSLDEQTSADASRKAREIVSRAEAEAAAIQKNAQKEFPQVARDACAAVVSDKQKLQREVDDLKKERRALAGDLNTIDRQLRMGKPQMGKTSEEKFKEVLEDKPKKGHWKGVLITIVILALLGVLAF